ASRAVWRVHREGDSCSPAVTGNLRRGRPKPIPAWVHNRIILRGPLFDDFAIALSAQRIHFEDVSVSVAQGGIDHDGKVIVQVHGQISTQLGGNNVSGRLVIAVDAEINMAGIVEHANFGFLGGRRSLEWL